MEWRWSSDAEAAGCSGWLERMAGMIAAAASPAFEILFGGGGLPAHHAIVIKFIAKFITSYMCTFFPIGGMDEAGKITGENYTIYREVRPRFAPYKNLAFI